MSKWLTKVTTGKKVEPLYGIVYGVEGVGKTSLGARLPKVIFLGPESSSKFDVARFPKPETFKDVIDQLTELRDGTHEYKSLCIDSLDWLENVLFDDIKKEYKVQAIEDAAGSYGRYIGVVNKHWMTMIRLLEEVRAKGINILLLAHFEVKVFNDPLTALPYDRYRMKLQEKSAALWREAVDFVLFANFKNLSYSDDKKAKKGRALNGDVRVLYTEKRAAHDGKNRFGLPYEMTMDSSVFDKMLESESDKLVEARQALKDLILDIPSTKLSDEIKKDLTEKATATLEKYKDNLDGLRATKNRLVAAMGDE